LDHLFKPLSYVEAAEIHIPEKAARKGLKKVGIDDWFINSMMELDAIVSAGYASNLSSAVEELTGKKPISFCNSQEITSMRTQLLRQIITCLHKKWFIPIVSLANLLE
jgi:hypothetical protein